MFFLLLLVFGVAQQTSTAHDYIIGYICRPEPALEREVCPDSYPGISSEVCLALDCCYAENTFHAETLNFVTCFNKTVQTFNQAIKETLLDLTDAVKSLQNTTEANTAEIRNVADNVNSLRNTTTENTAEIRNVNDKVNRLGNTTTANTAEIRNVNDKTQTLRSDLTTLNGKHNQDTSAQEVINARLETTVAFMARMNGTQTGPKTIPYGNAGVALNVGGGFNASRHGFTAKHVGLYQFTWSFGMYLGTFRYGQSRLHKNGAAQDVGTYTYRPPGVHSNPMVTQTALLELAVGDVVDVRLLCSMSYAYGDSIESEAVFSGSLIRRTG